VVPKYPKGQTTTHLLFNNNNYLVALVESVVVEQDKQV